jgi:thiamine-phosphate pyrophosphorylase
MRRRHPVPHLWLMTDERFGDRLWPALEALPRGSGVVFRHYSVPHAERRALFARVRKVTRRRGLVLVRAGAPAGPGADGLHRQRHPRLTTWPVHSRREAVAALRAGADALFVSPVFPTRSHPGGRALGRVRLGLMVRGLDVPVIALGGMTPARVRSLCALGIHGWAAIDAWADQKRKAVPT